MILRATLIFLFWCVSCTGLWLVANGKSLREAKKEKSVVNELIEELVLLDMLENSNSSSANSTDPIIPGGSFSFSTFFPSTLINISPFPSNSVPYVPTMPSPPLVSGGGPPLSNAPDVQFCRQFENSNTANATTNTCQCNLDACAGEVVSVSACHCQGPVKLRFYEISSMSELQPEDVWVDYLACDNGCPTYGFRNNFAFPCRQFGIVGGCEGNEACSTRLSISVYPSARRILGLEHPPRLPHKEMPKGDQLLTKEDEEELSRTAEAELQLLHSLEAEAALKEAAHGIIDHKSLTDYVHMLYAPQLLNHSFNVNVTRDDDHTDDFISYLSPLIEDDDEYFNTVHPYLETVCSGSSYTTDSNALTLSNLLMMVVAPGAVCLILMGLCLVWWFRPQKLQAWKIYLQSGCVSMIYSTGFHASYFYYLYNQSDPSAASRHRNTHEQTISVAPVTATAVQVSSGPVLVDLTPWEREQGFFRPDDQHQHHQIDAHLRPPPLMTTANTTLRHSEQKFDQDDQHHNRDEEMQTFPSPHRVKPQNNNSHSGFMARFVENCKSLLFGSDISKIQPEGEEEDDEDDSSGSQMCELEDDDPRVLRKIAKNKQRKIAESNHLHHSVYSRHGGAGGVPLTTTGVTSNGSGRIPGSYHANPHTNDTTNNYNANVDPNTFIHLSKLTPDQFLMLLSPPNNTDDACSVPGSVRSFHSLHTPVPLTHQHSSSLFGSNSGNNSFSINNNNNHNHNNNNYNNASQFHLLHHLSEKSSSVERGSESLDVSGQFVTTVKNTDIGSENQSEQRTATLFFDDELGAVPLIGGGGADSLDGSLVVPLDTATSISTLQLQ